MKLTDETGSPIQLIRAYAPGELRIGETLYRHSCLVSAERVIEWRPRQFDDITAADLEEIIALDPEVVVLGTGTRQRFPRHELLRTMITRGIGMEVMDTGAACRTYNVLVSEDRRVIAALLLADN